MGMQLAPYISRFAEYLSQEADRQRKVQMSNMQMQYSNAAMNLVNNARTQEELNSGLQQGIQLMDYTGDKEGIKNLVEMGKFRQSTLQRQEDQSMSAFKNMDYFDPGKMYSIDGKMVNGQVLQKYLTGLTPMQQEAYLKGQKELKATYGIDGQGAPFKAYQDEAGNIAGTFALSKEEASGNPEIQKLWDKREKERLSQANDKTRLGMEQQRLRLSQAKFRLEQQRLNTESGNNSKVERVGQDGNTGEMLYGIKGQPGLYTYDGKNLRPTSTTNIVTTGQANRNDRIENSQDMTTAAAGVKRYLIKYKDKLPSISDATNMDIMKLSNQNVYTLSKELKEKVQWEKYGDDKNDPEAADMFNVIKSLENAYGGSAPAGSNAKKKLDF